MAHDIVGGFGTLSAANQSNQVASVASTFASYSTDAVVAKIKKYPRAHALQIAKFNFTKLIKCTTHAKNANKNSPQIQGILQNVVTYRTIAQVFDEGGRIP